MSKVIGIDLGGTKVTGAVIDEQGQVLRQLWQATANSHREALLQQLTAMVEQLRTGFEIAALGIGTPGLVDPVTGEVLLATNLPGWSQTAVKAELEQRTGLATCVANDANAAALGEAWLGAGRNRSCFAMLTLGTGVGGAIFDQQSGLWTGAKHRAAEFGHSILYPAGLPCACGQRGCADQYLSGQAVSQAYRRMTGRSITCERVFDRAAQGEATASLVIENFARDLAIFLINLQNALDPEAVVIAGGLLQACHTWAVLLDKHLSQQSMSAISVRWVPAILGAMAGLIGAGRLALQVVGQDV
ncbi:MAG: ROK family protein [Bacillota bacterium]|jgi:glucokinase